MTTKVDSNQWLLLPDFCHLFCLPDIYSHSEAELSLSSLVPVLLLATGGDSGTVGGTRDLQGLGWHTNIPLFVLLCLWGTDGTIGQGVLPVVFQK